MGIITIILSIGIGVLIGNEFTKRTPAPKKEEDKAKVYWWISAQKVEIYEDPPQSGGVRVKMNNMTITTTNDNTYGIYITDTNVITANTNQP